MYKVQFLNDQEFENLHYPDMQTSLGVADPRTNTAYVRRTGIKVLDAMNLVHELDHLKDGDHGEFSNHKRHGVYYKDFGSVMPALGTIFGTMAGGPLGPAFGGAIGQFAGSNMNKGGGQQPQMQEPQQQGPSMPEAPAQPASIVPGGSGGQAGGASGGDVVGKALANLRQQQGQNSAFGQMNQGYYSGRPVPQGSSF